jgi:hypothetical protein
LELGPDPGRQNDPYKKMKTQEILCFEDDGLEASFGSRNSSIRPTKNYI